MTIYDLKRLNKANGGYFFDRKTMAHFGDTLKNFNVKRNVDLLLLEVKNKRNGAICLFSKTTGRFVGGLDFF